MSKRLFFNQDGNVVILVALLALVFMAIAAIVIDVGLMYSERAKLVSAVDAAALAGVWALPEETDAITKASNYLDKNVDDISKIIEREIKITNEPGNIKAVSVRAVKEIGLFFARAIGFYETNVEASAKASRTPAKGVNGVIPVGMTKANWNKIKNDYETYKNEDGSITIKVIATKKNNNGNNNQEEEDAGEIDPEKGNFYALDLNYGTGEGGSGGNEYKEFLGTGYPKMLYVGDIRATETGNMVGPTKQGLNTRLAGNTCSINIETKTITHTCGGEDKDCPRLGYIPVFEIVNGDLTGKTTIRIVGFLPLYIANVDNDGEVNGVFLDDTITDGVPGSEMDPEYGVNAPRLIE